MREKPSWGWLYGPVVVILGSMVAVHLFGLRGAAEQRFLVAALAALPLVVLVWQRVNRRALMLENAEQFGDYAMRVHEPLYRLHLDGQEQVLEMPAPTAGGRG